MSKVLSFKNVINIKIINNLVYIIFLWTKSSKYGLYILTSQFGVVTK